MRPPGDDTPVVLYEALLRETLHRVWGFSDFRPLQRDAMHAILESRDSVVVLPTGGGKSLCFQAPAIVEGPAQAGHHHPAEGPAQAGQHHSPAHVASGFSHQVASGFSRTGVALVVSPLISLMKDQVDGLRVDGVAASYLNSTLLPHERDEVLASVREDRCRLLYVSPERIVALVREQRA